MKIATAWLMASVLGLAACSEQSAEDVNATARKSLQAGDAHAAVIALKAHLAEHPDAAQTRFLLGTALAASGNANAAEVELRKALALKFAEHEVVPALARVLLAQGHQKKLIEEFGRTTLSDKAASAELMSALGVAHARLGDRAAAAALYRDALLISPQLVSAQLGLARLQATSGNGGEALRLLDVVLAAHPADPEAWQIKGDVLRHSAGEPAQALAAYRKALEVSPKFLPAHLAIMEQLLAASDLDAAKEQFKRLITLAPNLPQARLFEAQLAYADRDFARARSLLQQLLAIYPEHYNALVLQGAVSLAMNANRSAETTLTKALRLNPGFPLARLLLAQTQLRTGQHAEALATLAPMLTAKSDDTTVLTLAGQAHLQAGNFAKADDYYQRASQLAPGDANVRTAAASARLAKGDTKEAMAELYAVAAAEQTDTADLMIISAQRRRGDLAAALKAADGLVAKQPKRAMPLELSGRLHLAMNDRAAARKRFEQAVALEPQYFPAVMGLALLDSAESKRASARARLQALLQANPKRTDALMALIELDIVEKVPKESVAKSLAALIAIDPLHVPARLKLVELHLAAQAPKLAIAAAQDALAASPENPDYFMILGRAQLAAGDVQQAVNTYSKLASLLPKQVTPLLALSDAQVAQGNPAAAAATLRRALDVAPANAEVHRRLIAIDLASKQPDKAVAFARKLQRQDPKKVGGYLFEAEIEASRGNWSAAAAVLKAAVSNAPEQARPAAVKLVVAYVAAGKPAEAKAVTTNWLGSHPKDSAFLIESGELLMLRKSYPEAEAQYSAAAALAPDTAIVQNNLAWVMLKQQKPQALAHAERAVALAPRNAVMLDTYALALAADGQLDKAIETSSQALSLMPQSHVFRLNLARSLVQAKRFDQARAELTKLEALGPKFQSNPELKALRASMGQ